MNVLVDLNADFLSYRNLTPILTELFVRGRRLKILFFFIAKSYFLVPKNIRLNSTYYFIMKIPNKLELQQIAINHSSGIEFEDFMNHQKKCITERILF